MTGSLIQQILLTFEPVTGCIVSWLGGKLSDVSAHGIRGVLSKNKKVVMGGVEPSTVALLAQRSNQLSYTTSLLIIPLSSIKLACVFLFLHINILILILALLKKSKECYKDH